MSAYQELILVQSIQNIKRACKFVQINNFDSLRILIYAVKKYHEVINICKKFYDIREFYINPTYINSDLYHWIYSILPEFIELFKLHNGY
jgi:hypothetical protein